MVRMDADILVKRLEEIGGKTSRMQEKGKRTAKNFSGKHSAMLQLLCEDFSFRFPQLSGPGYSFTAE